MQCAVSLLWLVDEFLPRHPEIESGKLKTFEVVNQIVKPEVEERKCRYVDLIDDPNGVSRGKDIWFISHTWSQTFIELVGQIKEHFKPINQAIWRNGEATLEWRDIYVWLDILAINQNFSGNDLSQLHEVIKFSQQTLMVMGDGSCLSRIWCLYEAWHSGKKGKDALKLLAYGARWERLEKVFLDLDVANAKAARVEDLSTILTDQE